ncbi:nitrite reductase large subunit NirB [Corynebacterium kalidii]|uniref:assimilatory sulfite reductase (ferredoxin) n=1 Tax=Corynebacterium kalidii TaxID=2931982 RepID=A0A9X1WH50_9CORY|nr:nitrite reductase large subunit NirB [Corynebacterium kalidii]MCJ7857320.1 nitrite reductase large subunit NirB [Corynebacterium kalidii]
MNTQHSSASPGSTDNTTSTGRIVIVGFGMVGHRTVTDILERDPAADVTVISGEDGHAYDRVALSSYVSTWDRALLELTGLPESVCVLHTRATGIDRDNHTVSCEDGTSVDYNHLVLATGSYAFVPPVPGNELDGCMVYRTVDDLDRIRQHVEKARADGRAPRGAVIGGGLLGLEAANALKLLGAEPHIIERSPRLMPIQVDADGGVLLADKVRELGVTVHLGTVTTRITDNGTTGRLTMELSPDDGDGHGTESTSSDLSVDIVIFSTGVRPHDSIAGTSVPEPLETAPRGGILVDRLCRTSDPDISAVGECAAVDGVCYGLVAPGYTTAGIVADRLTGREPTSFEDPDMSTKLKLMGVDVASFGDAHGATDGARPLTVNNPFSGSYGKIVMDKDGKKLLGGILVGDCTSYAMLRPMVGSELENPMSFLAPAGADGGAAVGVGALPDDAQICSCNAVSKRDIRDAVGDGACSVPDLKTCTRAGTSCGSCVGLLKQLLDAEGVEQSTALCEHFTQSRAELFECAAVSGIRDFPKFIARFGSGRGCEICKPTMASIFATLDTGHHVLDDGHAALQDSNDRFLANIQRNGSYSVVPRMPGGQVTAEQLIIVGEIARDFDLYTKVTGAQRIDMFGARVDQLPAIWQRLVNAGMESGQAYGKALRAVKSCVGTDWCRYGQQDSVKMAVDLELRYRGLRSPHKLKMGVSGCARECAEARSKDVGVIATEHGWNLYVGGNGGATPRHAELLAGDLDEETLIRYIDRYIGFYVRTADRLQRTAAWQEGTEGGLQHIREVVCEDSLGIGADLEDFIAHHVDDYTDEWKAVLDDPEKLRRFVSFVNAPESPDPTVQFQKQDGRKVPLPLPELRTAV